MSDIEKVAPNFKDEEFECNCGCGENRISLAFVKRLQAARTIYGKPMVIISGARCPEHNDKVGGSSESAHVPHFMPDNACHASDIVAMTSREKWNMLDAFKRAGFTRVGIMKDTLHVDDADIIIKFKDPNVLFHYYG